MRAPIRPHHTPTGAVGPWGRGAVGTACPTGPAAYSGPMIEPPEFQGDAPRQTPAQRRQKRVAGASIAGLVVFLLAFWVLGHTWPSPTSPEGWGSFLVCVGLGAMAFGAGLALRDPDEVRREDDDPERGIV